MKKELVYSTAAAILFVVISYLLYRVRDDTTRNDRAAFILRGAVIAFIAVFLVMYFVVNDATKEVMDNVITGDPDF